MSCNFCQRLHNGKLFSISTRVVVSVIAAAVLCVPALRFALTGLGSIYADGAFSPRQWILERLEEIEDAPADNHVIVEAHETANLEQEMREKGNIYHS